MVERDEFKQQFSAAVPLLRAGGLHKKVSLSPLMRYAIESCCDSAEHCFNRGPALNRELSEGLATLETWIDDQSYLKRICNFLVVNPNMTLLLTMPTKKIPKLSRCTGRRGQCICQALAMTSLPVESWRKHPLQPSAGQWLQTPMLAPVRLRQGVTKAEAEAEAKTMEEDMLTSWRGDKTGCPTMTQLCTAPTMKIEDTEAGEEVMVEDIKVS
jgi:hypothetical protein